MDLADGPVGVELCVDDEAGSGGGSSGLGEPPPPSIDDTEPDETAVDIEGRDGCRRGMGGGRVGGVDMTTTR